MQKFVKSFRFNDKILLGNKKIIFSVQILAVHTGVRAYMDATPLTEIVQSIITSSN